MGFVDDVADVVGFYDVKDESSTLVFCEHCLDERNIWGDGAVTKQECEKVGKPLVCDGCGKVLYNPAE